jgi:hypothetical protein
MIQEALCSSLSKILRNNHNNKGNDMTTKFSIGGIKVEIDTSVIEELAKKNIDAVTETANAVAKDLITNIEKELATLKAKLNKEKQ